MAKSTLKITNSEIFSIFDDKEKVEVRKYTLSELPSFEALDINRLSNQLFNNSLFVPFTALAPSMKVIKDNNVLANSRVLASNFPKPDERTKAVRDANNNIEYFIQMYGKLNHLALNIFSAAKDGYSVFELKNKLYLNITSDDGHNNFYSLDDAKELRAEIFSKAANNKELASTVFLDAVTHKGYYQKVWIEQLKEYNEVAAKKTIKPYKGTYQNFVEEFRQSLISDKNALSDKAIRTMIAEYNKANNIEVAPKVEVAPQPIIIEEPKQAAPEVKEATAATIDQKQFQIANLEEYIKKNPGVVNLKALVESGQAEIMAKFLNTAAKAMLKRTDIIEENVKVATAKTIILTQEFANAFTKDNTLASRNLIPNVLINNAASEIDPKAQRKNSIRITSTIGYLGLALEAFAHDGIIQDNKIYHNGPTLLEEDFGINNINKVINGVTYTKQTELVPASLQQDNMLKPIKDLPIIYNDIHQHSEVIRTLAISYQKLLDYAGKKAPNAFSDLYKDIRAKQDLPKNYDVLFSNFKMKAGIPLQEKQPEAVAAKEEVVVKTTEATKPDSNVIALSSVKAATTSAPAVEQPQKDSLSADEEFKQNPEAYLREMNPVAWNKNIFFQVKTPKDGDLKDSVVTIRSSLFDYAEAEFKYKNKKPIDVKNFFNKGTMNNAREVQLEHTGFTADYYSKLLEFNQTKSNIEVTQENGQSVIRISGFDDNGIVKYFGKLAESNYDRAAKIFLDNNAGAISYAFNSEATPNKVSVNVDQYGHLNVEGFKDKNVAKEYLIPKMEDILHVLGHSTSVQHSGTNKSSGFSMNSAPKEALTKLCDALELQQDMNREAARAKKQQASIA